MNNPTDNHVPPKPRGLLKRFNSCISPSCSTAGFASTRPTGRMAGLTDLVFRLSEPYPEAVGIYIEHGKGYPTELIPWEKVARIEDEAIFITPAESGAAISAVR